MRNDLIGDDARSGIEVTPSYDLLIICTKGLLVDLTEEITVFR